MDPQHAMLEAAMAGDVAAVCALLGDAPDLVHADNGASYSPLYLAAEGGHREIVRLLVEAGAPLNPPTEPGEWSPLAVALAYGHDDVVDYLLAQGAQPDVWCAAALGDQARLATLLTQSPALLEAKGPDGGRPLHFAGTVAVATLLVERGADPLARDEVHENTPARWAAADGRRPAVARYLAAYDPETDLYLACTRGDAARVAHVLDADPALVNVTGAPRDLLGSGTPLHVAAEHGHCGVVELLLARGADPNLCAAWGHYPLHSAVMRGHKAIVERLLAYGAWPSVRDRNHRLTPREWALRFCQEELAALLERAHPPSC